MARTKNRLYAARYDWLWVRSEYVLDKVWNFFFLVFFFFFLLHSIRRCVKCECVYVNFKWDYQAHEHKENEKK